MAPGGLFALALAEEVDLSAAVGAGNIAHVLHKADDGNIHFFGHLHGLFHDHGDEVLRGGDNDDAVERNGLEDAQRHIARAGGHIDEEVVDIPDHVRPELLDNAADDGATPDDGIGLVLEQQVDGHQLHTCAAGAGIKPCLRAGGLVVHAEGLGDRGTRDIGVHDADLEAAAVHGDGKLACDHRLAHAALAGNDAEHLSDAALRMRRLAQGLRRRALRAALAAGGAIMGAFAHSLYDLLCRVDFATVYTSRARKSTARGLTNHALCSSPKSSSAAFLASASLSFRRARMAASRSSRVLRISGWE